jgi:hypothetical protein
MKPALLNEYVESPVFNPTTRAHNAWLRRNYVGEGRFGAHDQIQAHLDKHPGSMDRYRQLTDEQFATARANSPRPYTTPDMTGKPLVTSRVNERFGPDGLAAELRVG